MLKLGFTLSNIYTVNFLPWDKKVEVAAVFKCFRGLSWAEAQDASRATGSHQGNRTRRLCLTLSSGEGPGLDFWGSTAFLSWPLGKINISSPLSTTREAKLHCPFSLKFWQEMVSSGHSCSLPWQEAGLQIGQNYSGTCNVRNNPKNPSAQTWSLLNKQQCSCGFSFPDMF